LFVDRADQNQSNDDKQTAAQQRMPDPGDSDRSASARHAIAR
jgi:hypothetical protein